MGCCRLVEREGGRKRNGRVDDGGFYPLIGFDRFFSFPGLGRVSGFGGGV
jgi:hypothetical protein